MRTPRETAQTDVSQVTEAGTDVAVQSEAVSETPKRYEVTGLKAREDGTISLLHAGRKFLDLKKATQEDLKWLYDKKCPFVKVAE